jgi:hypothetical protein
MFNESQYTKDYRSIIEVAKQRGAQYKTRYMARKHLGYVESHHIIPESIGGTDDADNKVWLTAHEHLKCHLLLTEMCDDVGHKHKMLLAATRMMNRQDNRREREKLLPLQITEEEIAWLAQVRIDSAKAHSDYMSERVKGDKNPFYGRTHTTETNQSRRDKQVGIPKNHSSSVSAGRLKNSAHISAIVTGTKNPRYNPTLYNWHNIYTDETRVATRLEMITEFPALKSNISNVIKGTAIHTKGWRLIK